MFLDDIVFLSLLLFRIIFIMFYLVLGVINTHRVEHFENKRHEKRMNELRRIEEHEKSKILHHTRKTKIARIKDMKMSLGTKKQIE